MREGGTALTNQMNNINIDDVDEMRDDLAEAQDRNEEINTALADPMGGFDLDDDVTCRQFVFCFFNNYNFVT